MWLRRRARRSGGSAASASEAEREKTARLPAGHSAVGWECDRASGIWELGRVARARVWASFVHCGYRSMTRVYDLAHGEEKRRTTLPKQLSYTVATGLSPLKKRT